MAETESLPAAALPRTAGGGGELPLPPGPGVLGIARLLARVVRGLDPQLMFLDLFREYGPVARLSLGASRPGRALSKAVFGTPHSPLIAMIGPEAARLLMAGPPDKVQRAPIVGDDFPSVAGIDGELQIRRRKVVMQAFQRSSVASFVPWVGRVVDGRAAGWGESIDLHEQMSRLSLEILGSTMMGLDFQDPAARAFLDDYWTVRHLERNKRHLPDYQAARQRVWSRLRELIEERRRGAGEDVLSQMIRGFEGDPAVRLSVDDDEFHGYAYMLLEFGQSDLAIFLTCSLASLVARPDLEERLRAETPPDGTLETAVADAGTSLPFTTNLLREVERLYPPVANLFRYAAADLELHGYRIPAGSHLIGSIYGTHRLPELFADPERFDPDRFAPPREEHKKNAFALRGFGGGYHTCVAALYSRVLTSFVLHRLCERFRFVREGGGAVPPVLYGGIVQRPSEKIQLRLAPRRA